MGLRGCSFLEHCFSAIFYCTCHKGTYVLAKLFGCVRYEFMGRLIQIPDHTIRKALAWSSAFSWASSLCHNVILIVFVSASTALGKPESH